MRIPKLLLLQFLSASTSYLVHSAVWTNGPEDSFFCGFKWDDKDCQKRQHCPSGESEECEGNEDGIKCFANTNCDTRFGDGDWFVSGKPPKQSPGGSNRPTYTGKSENITDHYFCGVSLDDARNQCDFEYWCPSGASADCPQGNICFLGVFACDGRNLYPPTPYPSTEQPTGGPSIAGPTKIPTEMPIGKPEPLGTSDDLTDHWFCGIGIDDANAKCRVHCPTASECPMGQICYFGTQCDSRTHAPTPPPTRRPTPHPTNYPTTSPTEVRPTASPTDSMPPTVTPTEQGPTQSPTPSPSKRPTYAPMPSLQSSFYCGSDWNDAINNCKRKCPTGESTECPFDEFCFSLTPCTEEMGYPEDYGLGEGGGKTEDATLGGDGGCVPLRITINADHWPKETSWVIKNTAFDATTFDDEGEDHSIIAQGSPDDLVPGDSVTFLECVNNRNGCYEFTINDSGGDGICCEHGDGFYTVSYDGEVLKEGGAFYDFDTTPFGSCGATETPNKQPTGSVQNAGSGENTAHRCIAKPLIESGYVVSSDKCGLFVDCYNKHIQVGDDWFCDENSSCVQAPSCGTDTASVDEPAPEIIPQPATNKPTPEIVSKSPPTNKPTMEVVASRPVVARPKPVPQTSQVTLKTTNAPVAKMATEPNPTQVPTTLSPSLNPTTSQPTLGACDGDPCYQKGHCRSRYGFCGGGKTYCNEEAIWSSDCMSDPTLQPSSIPESASPTKQPITKSPVFPVTSVSEGKVIDTATKPPTPQPYIKPSGGFKKPGGGKGSASKPSRPARSHSPMTYYPKPSKKPVVETNEPTPNPITPSPSSSPASLIGSMLDASAKPTPPPTQYPTSQPTQLPVTFSPSNRPTDMPEPLDFAETDIVTDAGLEGRQPATKSDSENAVTVIEPGCEGQSCEDESWCRSRYGSCGPGFIYCNAFSSWTNSCPPVPVSTPKIQPTRPPTPAPTKRKVDTTGFVTPSSWAAPKPTKRPTHPPLAKPTLPWIGGVDPTPFKINGSFSESDEADKASSNMGKSPSNSALFPTNLPPPPPTATSVSKPKSFDGKNYSADHGEDSRLIAYVANWQTCPTAEQVDAYSHIVIAFAVTYTYSPGQNTCDTQCNIASTVPICNNINNQDVVDQWRAAGKKVILSFGGAGMGGSWSGDTNNCWDYCFGKEEDVASQLVEMVQSQNFDGIDIDYEYCYDVRGGQHFGCTQVTAKYSDRKAQKFLNTLTSKLRIKLDVLQASNGYNRGRYEVTHAPLDTDLTPDTRYFQILRDRRTDLDFVMPQFYNGYIRPAADGVGGTGVGSQSAADLFGSLANEMFDSEPHKVVFGFCISDCEGTKSNVNESEAAKIMKDLKTLNNGEFACNGGAFMWVAEHDIDGAWSDAVVAEVSKTAGCSHIIESSIATSSEGPEPFTTTSSNSNNSSSNTPVEPSPDDSTFFQHPDYLNEWRYQSSSPTYFNKRQIGYIFSVALSFLFL